VAFGDRAARWAARLEAGAPVVACEPAQAAAALACGLELRREGRAFYLSIDLEDARRTAFRAAIHTCMRTVSSTDELRLALEQPVSQQPLILPSQVAPLTALVQLAHGLVVRSWIELDRLRTALGILPRNVERTLAPVALALEHDDVARTDVVVWAPYDSAESLAPFVIALQDLALPLTIVTADGAAGVEGEHFVPAVGGSDVLRRARVIVDASGNDPAVAVALASLGRPLCVASDSGAGEFLDGAPTYAYWERRSILAAVADALGAEGPRPRETLVRPLRPFPAPRPQTGREQLVSIVIPTRNRLASLDATLRTIDRQTYPALEIVVVNDDGSDPSAIVAAHPRARTLATPTHLGAAGARNVGLRAASGEYILFFDDDDEMFPDHVAALVATIERSNLDVAYGQMLNGFFLDAGTDQYVLDGVSPHEALLDHADIQWAGALATTSVLFRRKLVDEIGELDGSLDVAEDYDYWYRLAQRREWARVPFVTALYHIRLDRSNSSTLSHKSYVTAYRHIYRKHPTKRTLVGAGREAFIEGLLEGAARVQERVKDIPRD